MDKPEVLKKIDTILTEFERNRTFGTVEICFNSGQPQLIRKLTTEKLNNRENTHAYRNER